MDQLERNSSNNNGSASSGSTKFAGRWSRESCQYCPVSGAYIKNLHNLQGIVDADNMERVVLVDNYPLSFLAQPDNGIFVSIFYNDPTDATLPAVWQLFCKSWMMYGMCGLFCRNAFDCSKRWRTLVLRSRWYSNMRGWRNSSPCDACPCF